MKNPTKNLNEHVVKYAIILIGVAFLVAAILTACRKEVSSLRTATIESDHQLMPPEGYNKSKRDYVPEEVNRGKGGTKGPKGKPTTPTDTTPPPPPPPTGGAVILLDFDGGNVASPYWNVSTVSGSGMTATEIQTVMDSVRYDFREFGVTVTTDEALYSAANPYKRTRIYVTEDWQWYGQAGGVAYVSSFTWGDNTPAFVFSSLLSYSAKYVWEAVSHEAGHTLGLRHQAEWSGTTKVSEYREGVIMGVGYYRPSDWTVGLNSLGITQDDKLIIKNTLNN